MRRVIKIATFYSILLFTLLSSNLNTYAIEQVDNVNITVPTNINVIFNADGTNSIDTLNVNNKSLVPITINNISTSLHNGWSLVSSKNSILRDKKELSFNIEGKDLISGSNPYNIIVNSNVNKILNTSINRGVWSKGISEKALDLSVEYSIGKSNFTLVFNTDGGNSVSNITAKNGDDVILPSTSKKGYTFTGWKDSSGVVHKVGDSYTMPIGGETLTAQWTPVNYAISYNLVGGSASGNPTSYNISTATFTLKNPTRTGYTFTGWTGSNGTMAQTSVSIVSGSTGNKSYTANWSINTYTLTFDPNGAFVNPTSKRVVYNEPYGTLPTPSKAGYIFQGWYTSRVGGTKVDTNTRMGGSNTTIYARWQMDLDAYDTLTDKIDVGIEDDN